MIDANIHNIIIYYIIYIEYIAQKNYFLAPVYTPPWIAARVPLYWPPSKGRKPQKKVIFLMAGLIPCINSTPG